MKKFTCLFIAILFAVIAKSQNTCLDATVYLNSSNLPIPAPGTISPSGPDLGCLVTTARQVWVYFPICRDYYLLSLEIGAVGSFPDSIGAIFYGPIPQKGDCSDLTASTIIACKNTSVLGPGGFVLNINEPLHAGNYYYLLITFSDSIIGNVDVRDFYGTLNITNCYQCNNQVSVLDENNLCMVTVDTAINKCVLTWEEFSGPNLLGYKIDRESTLTGVYDSLTTIPLGSSSTYTDMTSSPSQHNYTYGVTAVDSCGQSYPVQSPLTSIHLISFAGGNNQANLIWNNVYTNNDFVPQYYIHRNNNGTGWQLIDSIGITLPTITYTDIFAPAGTNQYTVELQKIVPCIPMRSSSSPYQSVFSNTSIAIVTSTEEISGKADITIYPNPANDFFSIYFNMFSEKEITVTLFNLYGQKLKTLFTDKRSVGKHEIKLSLKDLPQGVYFVKLNVDGKEEVRKVMKY